MDMVIAPSGEIRAIYSEEIDLRLFGGISIERASRVEPNESGQWLAEIVNGPTLGPFDKRSDALAAEIDWLTRHRLVSSPVTNHSSISAVKAR